MPVQPDAPGRVRSFAPRIADLARVSASGSSAPGAWPRSTYSTPSCRAACALADGGLCRSQAKAAAELPDSGPSRTLRHVAPDDQRNSPASSAAPMIDVSVARRLIDSQFPPWSHLPITAVEFDGWDNHTFRLGSQLKIRLPTANRYATQVDKEHRWLPVIAPQLPLPIPTPIAKGEPDDGFPYPWSVYRWLDGAIASKAPVGDLPCFAATLGRFLNALGGVDATGGPQPGPHNFYRGGPLSTYEAETFKAIEMLGTEIPSDAAKRVWFDAMTTSWDREPVWFHGDVAAANLLVCDGRLAAVLDFDSCGVGDPACDAAIAWTFFSGATARRSGPGSAQIAARGRAPAVGRCGKR